MGLDQYAFRVKRSQVISPVKIEDFHSKLEEIMYWRKCYPIQEWAERLYVEKGGTSEFNCEFVELTDTDLNYLEKFINGQKTLKKAELNQFEINASLDFIDKARIVLQDGDLVYYYSWW